MSILARFFLNRQIGYSIREGGLTGRRRSAGSGDSMSILARFFLTGRPVITIREGGLMGRRSAGSGDS
ncbi:MAG: hypothetical protein B6244_07060 [Candidatus Cloacimonetes bacterium 4572_55]|nr:MAG: hypothetical protein B6244_07060 [Candidatus Cloacimonetes bacterium 4572_55]